MNNAQDREPQKDSCALIPHHTDLHLSSGDSRFTHRASRFDPHRYSSPTGAAARTALRSQFVSPTFEEFMGHSFGVEPVVLRLPCTSTALSVGTSGPASSADSVAASTQSDSPANAAEESTSATILEPPADWIRHTAHIAAAAARQDGAGSNRLVIVDPVDPERRRPREEVDEAFAAAERHSAQPRKRDLALAGAL